eukprot:scaffold100791_cov27-Tisochrysis_lutea.AAC.1
MDEGGGRGRLAGLRVTKPVPKFLRQFQPDEGGIEVALRRHAEPPHEDERPELEDEAPQIVDELDALPSKQRTKRIAGREGSLRFKGDDNSASAKFVDSAFSRIAHFELHQKDRPAVDAANDGSKGPHVFSKKIEKKRKVARDGFPTAKAVKNPGLLSFAVDDDE